MNIAERQVSAAYEIGYDEIRMGIPERIFMNIDWTPEWIDAYKMGRLDAEGDLLIRSEP